MWCDLGHCSRTVVATIKLRRTGASASLIIVRGLRDLQVSHPIGDAFHVFASESGSPSHESQAPACASSLPGCTVATAITISASAAFYSHAFCSAEAELALNCLRCSTTGSGQPASESASEPECCGGGDSPRRQRRGESVAAESDSALGQVIG